LTRVSRRGGNRLPYRLPWLFPWDEALKDVKFLCEQREARALRGSVLPGCDRAANRNASSWNCASCPSLSDASQLRKINVQLVRKLFPCQPVFTSGQLGGARLDLLITRIYNTCMAASANAQPNPQQLSMRQALAIPAFRKLWLATLVSVFGDFLALYAIFSEMTFRMHASPRAITLVTVFFLLPLAFVGPLAGVFVDRWEPKRTMVTSDLARAALVFGLVIAHAPWHIYLVFFALSTFSSFFNPARSVVMPRIVPLEGLMGANAVIQQTVQMLQMGSPVLAGILAGWAGPSSCYYLDSASFVFSGLMIATMVIPARAAHAGKQMKSVMHDLSSGMRFILGHPVISFVILSIAAGTFAISAFSSLIAVYVRDVLHANSVLFGALGSVIGAGMLGGGMVVTPLARHVEQKAHLVNAGILTCGAFIAMIARIPHSVAALVGCFGIGLGAALLTIPAMALMQGQVPPEMRGRVSSSSMSLISISQGIALLFAGDLASRFGIVSVFYGSAVLLLLISAGGAIRLRKPLEAPRAKAA
jgi:MFS transporter, DHA3 family, macrolide efflux protein